MGRNRVFRLSSVLLALALLLGIVVTGCSDKDRDSNSVSSKLVTFVYEKEATPAKVASSATTISVEARDADDEMVYSKLDTNEVKNQYDETTGKYEAITSVDVRAAELIYTFSHTDAEGNEVFDGAYIVSNVATLADGDSYEAKETDAAGLFCKFYGTDKQEITEVTVNEQFALAVFVGTATAAVDITEEVEAIGYDSDLVKQDEKDATLFTAMAKGTAEFSAKYGDVIYDNVGFIKIVDSAPAVKVYVCPQGYDVTVAGDLINDKMQLIQPEDIPETFEAPALGHGYSFVVVEQDQATFTNVTENANIEVTMETETIENEGARVVFKKTAPVSVKAVLDGVKSVNSMSGEVKDGGAEYYICPEDFSVEDGKLYDADGKQITDIDLQQPTEFEPTANVTYTFVVVEYSGCIFKDVSEDSNVLINGTLMQGHEWTFTEVGSEPVVLGIVNSVGTNNILKGTVK